MNSPAIAHRQGQGGQSLVELAITLTVLLVLLSGAVSFGMAYYSYVAMRDAAQEGALYGSFMPCDDLNGNGICEPDLGEQARAPIPSVRGPKRPRQPRSI